MSKASLRLETGKIAGIKYHMEYAVAQMPTPKDEDKWAVFDRSKNPELGDMAGAVFMLFDGHGGKMAADMCTQSLVSHLSKQYQSASANLRPNDVRDGLKAKTMERNAWMGYMMDTVVEESFHEMDISVKKMTTAGSTASLLFFKDDPLAGTELQSADPCILVKCAWVGDSRCTRSDLGPKGHVICEDLSRDHRPEAGPEMARLSQSVHGVVDLSKDKIVVLHDESERNGSLKLSMSVRGERGTLEPFHETFEKLQKDLEPHGGFKVCYDTPGFPVECSVHGPRSGSRHAGRGLSQSVKAVGSAPSLASMGLDGSRTGVKARARKPLRLDTASDSSSHSTGGNPSNHIKADTPPSSDKENGGEKPSDGTTFGTPIVKETAVGKTIELPSNVSSLETNEQGETIAKDTEGNAFFLGRLQSNGLVSGKRIFYPSGTSTAFTRSIGDRDAGNILISKPEINTLEMPVQPGSRFIVCSDGVWDCISTPDAHKMVKSLTTAKAASKLAMESLNKRRYGGFAADDITVMIIDVKYTSVGAIDSAIISSPKSTNPRPTQAPSDGLASLPPTTEELEPTGCTCFPRRKTAKA
eukprot:CAMPEP_0117648154 /NCGR_PEP_ID=MMETSP0804-20121206/238_1 /TAXON_ID=1074897 /ORGANISM="Tetraselmis astigmatica, Strain CCMP880" /LENGTH=583 /DNA_ID=CAMNT_0005453707 /DNA_START=392 /DNA_END=2143 /DNA_ORIENTATION=+